MTAEKFTGHVRAMRADNDWFGAEDLLDLGEVAFQIDAVWYDKDLKIGGKPSEHKYYLTLKDSRGRLCHKKMSINATRRIMLGVLYGGKSENWPGKWIWLTVTEVRDPKTKGAKTLGMVIVNRKDAPKSTGTRQPVTPDAPPPPVSDEHPTLTDDEKMAAAFDREVPQ